MNIKEVINSKQCQWSFMLSIITQNFRRKKKLWIKTRNKKIWTDLLLFVPWVYNKQLYLKFDLIILTCWLMLKKSLLMINWMQKPIEIEFKV